MPIKYLLTFFFLALGGLTLSAQSMSVDELPVRSRAERLVGRVMNAADMLAVTTAKSDAEKAVNEEADAIVETAMKYIGAKYRLGHTGPRSFDCSGFTRYVFNQKNIDITRTSRSQYTEGTPVHSTAELRKGDLVFFGGRSSTRRVGHVGIVTEVDPENGQFKFVHAARTGVRVDNSTEAYYSRRYIGARRILGN